MSLGISVSTRQEQQALCDITFLVRCDHVNHVAICLNLRSVYFVGKSGVRSSKIRSASKFYFSAVHTVRLVHIGRIDRSQRNYEVTKVSL